MYTKEEKQLNIDNGIPSFIGFSPSGNRFLCCTSSGYSYLFSYPELELLAKQPINNKGINEAAFSNDGSFFVTGGDDNFAYIVETENLTILRKLVGHHAPVFCCAVSSDNRRILTGSKDITFRVWDPRSSVCVQEVGGHTEPVCSISFNYDDSLILSASYDGIVRVWESVSYICLRTYVVDGSPITKALFTPNSCYVAIFSANNSAQIVELKTGEVYRVLEGIANEHFKIDASFIKPESNPSGELVATSEDGRIIGWDVQNANQNAKWEEAVCPGLISSFTILSDGSTLCYSSFDSTNIVFMKRNENRDNI